MDSLIGSPWMSPVTQMDMIVHLLIRLVTAQPACSSTVESLRSSTIGYQHRVITSAWHESCFYIIMPRARASTLRKRTWILCFSRRGTYRPYFTVTRTCRDTGNYLRADTPMRRIGSLCYITTSIRHPRPSVWSSPLSAPTGTEGMRPASWPATSVSWDCHLPQCD